MVSASVELLRIDRLRNVEHTEVDIRGPCSLFVGANGSGKTSVLEAVYLLARGKSFRGRRSGDLTSLGKEVTRVVGDIREGGEDAVWQLAYLRKRTVRARYVKGVMVGDGAEFARWFVVRLIGEGSGRLFEGEPAVRRCFLDLNLFHVEQRGSEVLRAFKRVLEQRNAWLRSGARGRPLWDHEFVRLGVDLDQARKGLFSDLREAFLVLAEGFPFLKGITLTFRSGWPDGVHLADAVAADSGGEQISGHTRVGPHRADFSLRNRDGELPMSRGQTKIVVCLLQLAFERVQMSRLGYGSVWLLDDLWADLDSRSWGILCSLFRSTGGQCIYTRVGDTDGLEVLGLPSDTRLFHVERGTVVDLS
ncbi:DNA replication and repair protein RecF [bacterium]|nr:DNA replication and repair protein RecF [bacterium]